MNSCAARTARQIYCRVSVGPLCVCVCRHICTCVIYIFQFWRCANSWTSLLPSFCRAFVCVCVYTYLYLCNLHVWILALREQLDKSIAEFLWGVCLRVCMYIYTHAIYFFWPNSGWAFVCVCTSVSLYICIYMQMCLYGFLRCVNSWTLTLPHSTVRVGGYGQ